MDATLRQIGIGDYVVGKHVGRMMSALGGRLAAFRAADFGSATRRNIFHDSPPSDAALALVAGRLERFAAALDGTSLAALAEGRLP
jgi:cytochrome b pre-mRNA-processing protein 3